MPRLLDTSSDLNLIFGDPERHCDPLADWLSGGQVKDGALT